jgi:hypothetical protein
MSKTKRARQGGDRDRFTYDIPEAGSMAGLSRGAAYAAAKAGQIPTLRFGSRLVVPKVRWDAILRGEEDQQ